MAEQLKKFQENIKESIKQLKDAHEKLGKDFIALKSDYDILKNYLVFNNRKYRKFVNKSKYK